MTGGVLKHGHCTRGARTATYDCWNNMIQRCENPRSGEWQNYGARGIKVCERWHLFVNFLADMGERPNGMSIERKDVNGNYELRNCTWATTREQRRNTRRNVYLEFRGERYCLTDWADRLNIPRAALESRLRMGWTIERALTEPVGSSRSITSEQLDLIAHLRESGTPITHIAKRLGVGRMVVRRALSSAPAPRRNPQW